MEQEIFMPKNVRQIGDIRGNVRIYMEDYVMTYIRRKEQTGEKEGFLGVFLGDTMNNAELTQIYIRGVLEVPYGKKETQPDLSTKKERTIPEKSENAQESRSAEENKKVSRFREKKNRIRDYLRRAEEEMDAEERELERAWEAEDAGEQKDPESGSGKLRFRYAGEGSIFGSKASTETAGEKENTDNAVREKQTTDTEGSGENVRTRPQSVRELCRENFGKWEIVGCCVIGEYPVEAMKKLTAEEPDTQKLIYHLQDQEENIYRTWDGCYSRIPGYFVFYEQNPLMQEYMAETFGQKEDIREKVTDKAIRSFRARVQSKDRARAGNAMRMASSFAALLVLAAGAYTVNRIDRMREQNAREYQQTIAEQTVSDAGTDMDSAGKGTGASEVVLTVEDPAQEDGNIPLSTAMLEMAEHAQMTEAAGTSDGIPVQGNAFSDPDIQNGNDLHTEPIAQGGTDNGQELSAAGAIPDRNNEALVQASSALNAAAEEENAAARNEIRDIAGSSAQPEMEPSENSREAEKEDPQEAASASAVRRTGAVYVIKNGDTLADICQLYYGSTEKLEEICALNQIENANFIVPGQEILLP